MKKNMPDISDIVIPDRSNEIIITGQNCQLEIVSIGQDAHGRRHVLLKSHPKKVTTTAPTLKEDI